MAYDRLKNLRLQVRARRSAVTAKENRIKRRTGVDVRGTKEDPRRPVNVVKDMTRPELLGYLKELNAFMSRSVGFVASAHGNLPKDDWLTYKQLENKYNTVRVKFDTEIRHIKIMDTDMTVGERWDNMMPDALRGEGSIDVKAFDKVNRDSKNVPDKRALEGLSNTLKKRLAPDYMEKFIATNRKVARQMLTEIGMSDAIDKIDSLTDFQFRVLWEGTEFPTKLSGSYHMTKVKESGEERWYTSVSEGNDENVGKFLSWAAGLTPRNGRKTNTRKKAGT